MSPLQKHVNEVVTTYANVVAPHNKSKASQAKSGRFREENGRMVGEARILRGMHAEGFSHVSSHLYSISHWNAGTHPVAQTGLAGVKPSADMLGKGYIFNASMQLIKGLGPLAHRVNSFLAHADPKHYAEAQAVRKQLCASVASYNAICAIDPLVYEGREVLYNSFFDTHTDSPDPHLTWAILAGAGDFTGGWVSFPHLGLRLRLNAGDMVAIRGRVVPHAVDKWSTGQRICIPHFSHSSVWKTVKNDSVDWGKDDRTPIMSRILRKSARAHRLRKL